MVVSALGSNLPKSLLLGPALLFHDDAARGVELELQLFVGLGIVVRPGSDADQIRILTDSKRRIAILLAGALSALGRLGVAATLSLQFALPLLKGHLVSSHALSFSLVR